MSFIDKAKDFAAEHSEKVSESIDKVQNFADEKTGGKHSEQIESAGDKAEEFLGSSNYDSRGGDDQR